MSLRTLVVAVATSSLVAGGTAAFAATPAPPSLAGTAVGWSNSAHAVGTASAAVPEDLGAFVLDVAASARASAVLTTDGRIRVWGTPTAPEVTEAPSGPTNAVAISLAMGQGAALHADGKVTSWGNSPALSDVPSDLRAKSISMTQATGYAVRTDGTVMTWGAAPAEPIPAGLSDVVDIAASNTHAVALHSNGTITAWGISQIPGLAPAPDLGGKKVAHIDTGDMNSGVILEDGSVKIWGAASASAIITPPDFAGKRVIDLDITSSAAAVTEDGAVHVWGSNTAIQTPPAELSGQPVSQVALGVQHVLAQVTAFRDLTKPTLAGTAQVGKTLTATPATFSLAPDAPATGQWFAGSTALAGQTGTTLALTSAHVGKAISYRSSATRGTTTVTSDSTATTAVKAAPAPPAPPVVKSKSKVSVAVKATGKTKKIAKKVKVTVTVKTTPKAAATGKVTITFKGKSKKKITKAVNAQGKATVTLKKIKRGSYTISVKYTGNSKVQASTAKKRVKI